MDIEASESVDAPADTSTPSDDNTGDSSQPMGDSKGYQARVDLGTLDDDTRKAVEGRFAHLSRMIKKTEQKYGGEVEQWRSVAEQQSRLIEDLQTNQGAVVDHLQSKSYDDAESKWKATMRTAFENGDINAQIEANEKLIEIRTQKEMLKLQQKNKPPKQERKQPVERASDTSESLITPQEHSILESWQEETDDNGNLLRPWAVSDNPNKPAPGLAEAVAVFNNPRFKTFNDKLNEIDRRMGLQQKTNGQAVLRGGLQGGTKMSKIALSPEIERLAIRTKFGGSKAKSDADHIQAYVKQMELVRSKKGAR